MALLSGLLSLAARKVGDLMVAVLGWSVTSIFGRLSRSRQVTFSGVLLLSLLWPVLVVGVFVPSVTSWMVAATPLHAFAGPTVVRLLSIALVVLEPPIVGLIARSSVPPSHRRSLKRSLLAGYPLTLGFGISCVVTAALVIGTKLGTVTKRWEDEHVYVQPMEDRYREALRQIALACGAVGLEVDVEDVPKSMRLPVRILGWFGRGAFDSLVPSDPMRLRGDALEAYLYPSDLLLRGRPELVARVQAALAETQLERHAYLVAEAESQQIQIAIDTMWSILDRHDSPEQLGLFARAHLQGIFDDLSEARVPYQEWVVLERLFRRVERVAGGGLRFPMVTEESAVRRAARAAAEVA